MTLKLKRGTLWIGPKYEFRCHRKHATGGFFGWLFRLWISRCKFTSTTYFGWRVLGYQGMLAEYYWH